MLLHRTHTLCRCHSLMFTVHFSKVHQIASNVLSFDLLPKQSIDAVIETMDMKRKIVMHTISVKSDWLDSMEIRKNVCDMNLLYLKTK